MSLNDQPSGRRHRALVFAGAGASYSVDKKSFPTTAGFFEQLPSRIRGHPLVGTLARHFEQKFGDSTPDVEKLLWCLEELINHLTLVQDPKSPLSWVVPNNALQDLLKLGQPVSHYAAAAQVAIPKLTELRDGINASLYDCYSTVPEREQLAPNWLPLLAGLSERGYWIDLVTTNYDLVLEEAVRLSGLRIGYGKTEGVISELDPEVWRKSTHDESFKAYEHGLITKLHGSLNWERGRQGRVAFGGTTYKSRHEHHVVIYPGFKGVPKDEPFASFHDYFEGGLRNADVVVFIGFAFRDEYINALLERSLKGKANISINPAGCALPGGLEQSCQHLNVGFDAESVRKVLKVIPAISS